MYYRRGSCKTICCYCKYRQTYEDDFEKLSSSLDAIADVIGANKIDLSIYAIEKYGLK